RRVVDMVERRRMIPQHAVSNGYFCRERLQGIEALIGVVDSGLQLAVLLGPGFQFVPHCVVVSDFPKHPGVRRHSGRHADGANQGEDDNTMYQIGWYHHFPELPRSRRYEECIALASHRHLEAARAFVLATCGRLTL